MNVHVHCNNRGMGLFFAFIDDLTKMQPLNYAVKVCPKHKIVLDFRGKYSTFQLCMQSIPIYLVTIKLCT